MLKRIEWNRNQFIFNPFESHQFYLISLATIYYVSTPCQSLCQLLSVKRWLREHVHPYINYNLVCFEGVILPDSMSKKQKMVID